MSVPLPPLQPVQERFRFDDHYAEVAPAPPKEKCAYCGNRLVLDGNGKCKSCAGGEATPRHTIKAIYGVPTFDPIRTVEPPQFDIVPPYEKETLMDAVLWVVLKIVLAGNVGAVMAWAFHYGGR